MATEIPDTLSPAGLFPAVEGPVQFRSFTTGGLPSASGLPAGTGVYDTTAVQLKITDGATWNTVGVGTVTSVGLAMPAIFSVSGSPVTSSGTLTATLANQAANLVFAGPTNGAAAAPTMRSLVDADLPATAVAANSYGSVSSVGTFTVNANGRLTAAASVSIIIAESQVTGLVSDLGALTSSIATKAASSVTLTAGAGLTGGGDLSTNRTFDVGAGTGITVAADSVAVDQAFSPTWTGTHTFNTNSLVLGAGVGLTGTAGAGALALGSLTGATALPTGNLSYAGASTKTISLVTTGAGSAVTITAGAASTWSTSSGALGIDSAAALSLGPTNATSVVIGRTGQTSRFASELVGINITPTYGLHVLGNGTRHQAAAEATSSNLTVNGSAGTTRYDYWIIENDIAGNKTVGLYFSTIAGNATLTSSNKNTLAWTRSAGAASVDIVRTVSGGTPSSTGSISLGNTGASFDDTGIAASAYVMPAFNATAQATLDSPISVGTATAPVNMVTVGGTVSLAGTPTVAAPTLTNTGANNGKNNSYSIIPYGPDGQPGAASAATINSSGPTQLSTTNYITISFPAVSGAIYYDVVTSARASQDSSGGTSTGLIASKVATTSFRDTGIIATAYQQNTTISSGLFLRNTAASTSTTTQQIAPGITFEAHAFKSNATAADQTSYGYQGFRALTGAASTTGEFYWSLNQGGAGVFSDVLKLTSNGGNNLGLTAVAQLIISSSAGQALAINGNSNVLLQVGGTSQASVNSGNISPITDVGGQTLGTNALRWNQGFFGKSISVLPTGTTPLAAVHVQAGGVMVNAYANPTITSITQGGTPGSTSYTYLIVVKDALSNKTLGSATVATATGASTLTGVNFNTLAWTATPGPGAGGGSGQVSYDVIRYASSGTGNSATLGVLSTGQLAAGFNDVGNAASAYTAPTYNATADIAADGKISGAFLAIAPTAITVPTGVTNFTVANPPQLFKVTAAAHQALTASTEFNDVLVDLSATQQFKTGTLALQRGMYVRKPTYAFVGASTLTKSSTLSVEGAPVAGTSATLSNTLAFNVESNMTALSGLSVGRHAVADTIYTVTDSDVIVGITSLTTGRTMTLPAASTRAGTLVYIVDESNGAAVNNITIARAGGDTIVNGATTGLTTLAITTNGGKVCLYSDGTSKWFVLHT